ncbi:MAG TPA: hypothetical protein VHC86_06780 [Opitutaceae bacterium]|nr:hypothetical protein [Opitutaceae bacterium]
MPARTLEIRPEQIHPLGGRAYYFDYEGSAADEWLNPWSRAQLYEDGRPYPLRVDGDEVVQRVGGGYWAHEAGRVVFAPRGDADPRRSGRRYTLVAPVLYRPWIADAALLGFALSVGGLYRLRPGSGGADGAPFPGSIPWKWHFAGAGMLLAAGLYCSTGSLSPYALVGAPRVNPTTGYLFNADYAHFRALFNFVDGRERSAWQGTYFLRRILFPVLAWPFMKAAGFESGGVLAGMVFNLAGFCGALALLRRRMGDRGAAMAGWLLALYPGAAYWVGQPYVYSLIFPLSLLLFLGVCAAGETEGRRLAVLSLAMGMAYLGYDLAVFFLPATAFLLAGQRRWRAAALAVALQLAPMLLWAAALRFVVRAPLENGNSAVYRIAVSAYAHGVSLRDWWPVLREAPRVAAEVFFGSNFIFLPALWAGLVALNPVTSRIRPWPAEIALLLAAGLLFAFLNLAPPYHAGWMMRGTWIARLYQPIFPALAVYAGRWWAGLRRPRIAVRLLIGALLAAAAVGNAAVIFGPILSDPGRISARVFYRFYDTSINHHDYRRNLALYGRRPLGFTHPEPRQPSLEDEVASIKANIAAVNLAITANEEALARIHADPAWIRVPTDSGLLPPAASIPVPAGSDLAAGEAALAEANDRLAAWEKAVLRAQAELAAARRR